jgi:hypothetical protein
LLPTKKPWSASLNATSKGLAVVFNGTVTQGLVGAVARPVVTQAVVNNSTSRQLTSVVSGWRMDLIMGSF